MMKDNFYTQSELETEQFASEFASTVETGTIIALHGNLGAGKTVFSRGFARGLNIMEPISSPTFTIIQEYPLENNNWLYHLDLYRITDSEAALAFGLDEYLQDDNSVMLIEWSERIPELLPPDTKHIYILHKDETSREIIIRDEYDPSLLKLD